MNNQTLEKARAKAIADYNNARKTYIEGRDTFLKALDTYKKDYEELFKELEITNNVGGLAQQGEWACCGEDEATAQPDHIPDARKMVAEQPEQDTALSWLGLDRQPHYTLQVQAQRTWVGLTHQETKDCMAKWDGIDAYVLCRAIEAKLKEKNT